MTAYRWTCSCGMVGRVLAAYSRANRGAREHERRNMGHTATVTPLPDASLDHPQQPRKFTACAGRGLAPCPWQARGRLQDAEGVVRCTRCHDVMRYGPRPHASKPLQRGDLVRLHAVLAGFVPGLLGGGTHPALAAYHAFGVHPGDVAAPMRHQMHAIQLLIQALLPTTRVGGGADIKEVQR